MPISRVRTRNWRACWGLVSQHLGNWQFCYLLVSLDFILLNLFINFCKLTLFLRCVACYLRRSYALRSNTPKEYLFFDLEIERILKKNKSVKKRQERNRDVKNILPKVTLKDHATYTRLCTSTKLQGRHSPMLWILRWSHHSSI